MSQLVPTRFLFRWSVPVRRLARPPRSSEPLLDLPEAYRVASLEELDATPNFADLRLGWSERGLSVSVEVRGRSRALRCSSIGASVSDGLHLWLDTRNTHNVHRATKFCQQFSLLPKGGGPKETEPLAISIPLARARDDAAMADASLIQIQSEVRRDGYWLRAWLPAEMLVGFAPAQHPQLGFHYVVRDSELGEQSLAGNRDFPYATDPSLWQTLDLIGD